MVSKAGLREGIALDFVATIRAPDLLAIETMRHQHDLRCWIENAGIITRLDRVEVVDLGAAHRLRRAMLGTLRWAIDGTRLDPAELAWLNSTAAGPGPRRQLVNERVVRTGDVPAALAALATDLLDLLDSPDRTRLRWCRDPECRRPMVDRSRGADRIWCGKACRERRNARLYRDRETNRSRRPRASLIADRG